MLAITALSILLAQGPGLRHTTWEPIGLSGGGAMFTPAISAADTRVMMLNCDMSGAYMSPDGGRDWKMINHLQLQSNTQCRPAFDPSDAKTVFAANGGSGLAVSRDLGEHWQPIGDLPGALVGDIVVDEGNRLNLIAATANLVYRSVNAGAKWTPCVGPHGTYISAHFDQTSSNLLRSCIVATSEGIWRSDDNGVTWTAKSSGLPSSNIKAFAGGSNRVKGKIMLYCAVPSQVTAGQFAGGIYKSTDRGETWQPAMGAGINVETRAFDQWGMGPLAQYVHLATTDADPARVYACNSSTGVPPPHQATVYRSDNAGDTWRAVFQADPRYPGENVEPDYTVVTEGQFYQDVPNIAVSWNDPSRLVMVNGGSCYTSTDGGENWLCGHTRAAPASVASDPKWLCTGLVVTSTWNYVIDPFDATRHFICYTDLGFARSIDRGASWVWWAQRGRAPWTNTCYQLAFDPKTAGRVWGAFSNVHDIPNGNIIWNSHSSTGPGGVCVSNDHGATWTPSSRGLPLSATTSIVVDPLSPIAARTLYAGQFGTGPNTGGVFRSDNGGATWMPKINGLGSFENRRVSKLVLHADGTLFAVVTALTLNNNFNPSGVGIYRSTDKGEHWVQINQSRPLLWPKDLTVDPRNSKVMYVGAADAKQDQAGLWRTLDGGLHWDRILKEGPEHFGAYLHPSYPGWIYATLTEGAPKAGLWLSKNSGQTWIAFDAFPFANAQRVTFDPSDPTVIYVTTFGGGVWRGPADPEAH